MIKTNKTTPDACTVTPDTIACMESACTNLLLAPIDQVDETHSWPTELKPLFVEQQSLSCFPCQCPQSPWTPRSVHSQLSPQSQILTSSQNQLPSDCNHPPNSGVHLHILPLPYAQHKSILLHPMFHQWFQDHVTMTKMINHLANCKKVDIFHALLHSMATMHAISIHNTKFEKFLPDAPMPLPTTPPNTSDSHPYHWLSMPNAQHPPSS